MCNQLSKHSIFLNHQTGIKMGTMGSDVTRGYRNQSPGKQIHQLFCFLKWQILFFFLLTILCIVFFRTILTSSKSCFLLILNGGLLQNKGNTIPFNLTEGCPLRALQLSHYRFKETRYIRILAQRWQNKVKMVRKKRKVQFSCQLLENPLQNVLFIVNKVQKQTESSIKYHGLYTQ